MTNRSQMPRRADAPVRLHLPAAERERQIIEAAAQFFSDNGFEGQTRELAKTMGITHSAIFRYFPTKDALIERVYEHVFVARWDSAWKALICDRSLPLEARLIQFYSEYTERIFDARWMRIFMFAGLKGHPMTHRYVALIRNQFIKQCCNELRVDLALPSIASVAMTPREEELFWGLHGAVFYVGIRTFIYEVQTSPNRAEVIRDQVQTFLAGAPRILREAVIASK